MGTEYVAAAKQKRLPALRKAAKDAGFRVISKPTAGHAIVDNEGNYVWFRRNAKRDLFEFCTYGVSDPAVVFRQLTDRLGLEIFSDQDEGFLQLVLTPEELLELNNQEG